MRWIESLLLALLVILTPNVYVSAQVAGSTSLGVTAEELRAVAVGWSAKKQVLGKTVYNENKEKVEAIDDLIYRPGPSRVLRHHWRGRLRRARAARCRHSRHPAETGRRWQDLASGRDQASNQSDAKVRIRQGQVRYERTHIRRSRVNDEIGGAASKTLTCWRRGTGGTFGATEAHDGEQNPDRHTDRMSR